MKGQHNEFCSAVFVILLNRNKKVITDNEKGNIFLIHPIIEITKQNKSLFIVFSPTQPTQYSFCL